MVSPVFQLIRTDKKADADDTGIKQVTDRMEIATGTVEVVDDDLSTSGEEKSVHQSRKKRSGSSQVFVDENQQR